MTDIVEEMVKTVESRIKELIIENAELRDELRIISELDGPDKAETVRQIHARARASLEQRSDQ
jgi:uncharacterized protein YeeX (DUF496 family)